MPDVHHSHLEAIISQQISYSASQCYYGYCVLTMAMPVVHIQIVMYRSLAKKGPWAVHVTLCSDRGLGGYL